MKVHIELDMTPEEARAFMGLPNVAPIQKQMMEDMQARMKAAFDAGDPDAMMKAWSPFFGQSGASADAFGQFQKLMWDTARAAMGQKDR